MGSETSATAGSRPTKPLGAKSYGSIGHLPNSRMGPGDHHVTEGQARICTERARDRHDVIIVQEKLDGSNVGVALHNGQILALGRAGYLAQTSPYRQHQLFAYWVRLNEGRFRAVLTEGERVCGEWLAQAHGTRYELPHEPFVAFDIIRGAGDQAERACYEEFRTRVVAGDFVAPALLSCGPAFSVAAALKQLEVTRHIHGAVDPIEGAVWRVERKGAVDFLAKYVRPDKIDGVYLAEMSGKAAVWHWQPKQEGD